MPIRRIAISVPEETANRTKRAAGAKPISTWVTDLALERRNATMVKLAQAFIDAGTPLVTSAGVVAQVKAYRSRGPRGESAGRARLPWR